ncbi:hypothetical protein C8Q79DRAFT_1064920 [Trametes meyenii]|nr:hypothetical protein C8Q79DRAFT_1064920 [Trametes meyenii]
MPRRTDTPATPAPPAPLPPAPRDILALAEHDTQWADNLLTLRRHWKWANFSQFFYTFAPLLAMPDLFLADIEDDLARGTNLYLPRIMHRLLYTLAQDRKISIDNWQSALRRQYLRRAPELNPIGPEPKVLSRESSPGPSEAEEDDTKNVPHADSESAHGAEESRARTGDEGNTAQGAQTGIPGESPSEPKAEPQEEGKVLINEEENETQLQAKELEESRDWLELPMLEKLDSLHLLTDWQFHNPYRVRQLMKDDDDAGHWRIEPIGYDAKTNAYWLIGPDRLWIQRVPPKPPRPRNLKRKRPAANAKKTPVKASTSRAIELASDDEDDEPVARSKRNRTQTQSQADSRPQANGRATRTSRRSTRASSPAPELGSPSKSTRAAKVQANKKLDLQAKELAEFQRQTARLASTKARTSPRKAPPSPSKRAVGTRVSARLRRSTRGADEDEGDDDDEWQQVPDEWLQDEAPATRRSSARIRAPPKPKPAMDEEASEHDATPDDDDVVEAGVEGYLEANGQEVVEAAGKDGGGDDVDAEEHELLQKAGLESDSVSDLTDLSEEQEDIQMAEDDGAEAEVEAEAEPETEAEESSTKNRNTRNRTRTRTRTRKSVRGRKSARQSRKAKTPAVEAPPPQEEPQEEVHGDEPPPPPLPEDFVEWEAIAITLPEWEHVADRFANATHYLEKALYKVLTQSVVPYVVEDLREQEKRRRMEEAIVHRKRSSRIAHKESEKEEARLAAKKRAEEEEKMARAKRQETRLKKEEAERAKRERARDQRRKEREEREARAQAKAKRAAREEEASVARYTTTPTANGTQASSSIQPSRVVTPNGVRSPNWTLDCEVCHKQGVNVDDGMAMVSCGLCNRWQHISCHDLNDQRSGRPRRNWENQQFYCSRCRQRAIQESSYGAQAQGYPAPSQYSWSAMGRTPSAHKPTGVDPYPQTSDLRYSHRSPLENGMGYPQQQYNTNHVGTASYSRSSYPNTGLSFSHYQPDQHGMSSRGALPNPSHSSSWANGNGYPSSGDPMTGRMQSAHFAPQYPHNGGVYASNRIPSAYQHSTSPTLSQPYNSSHDTPGTMSAARWQSPSSSINGYHSTSGSAVQSAAESLAYMHDSGGRYSGASSWPQQSYAHGQQQLHSSLQPGHASHSSRSYPQTPLAIDPLTGHGYQSSRAEQQVGSSVPNGSSFSFPS